MCRNLTLTPVPNTRMATEVHPPKGCRFWMELRAPHLCDAERVMEDPFDVSQPRKGSSMHRLLLLALLMAPASAICSQPKGLYQNAVISLDGGSLCLRANDVEELEGRASVVTNVSIYRQGAVGSHLLWQQSFPPSKGPAPAITSHECLDGLGSTGDPLPDLLPGTRYLVDVAAFIVASDGEAVRRWYSGNFCVVRGATGLESRQIVFDRRRKVWPWDICGI